MRYVSKLSLLVIALVLAFVAPTAVSQAAAVPKNPPGIKATKTYKTFKTYVNALYAKRNTPATDARKASMRRLLTAKHEATLGKVDYLHAKRVQFIAYQSGKQLGAKVDKIERNLARDVQALNDQLDNRLARLASARRKAVNSVKARYADQIADLVVQRKTLEKKLAKTTNLAKRAVLIDRIEAVQDEINALASARRAAIRSINARYNDQVDAAEAKYGRLIRSARAKAQDAIEDARRIVRSRQKARNAGAHRRQLSETALVKALYEKGVAAIDQMPAPA